MNVIALRRLDRWVGAPLCAFFTLLRTVFGRALPDCSLQPRSLLFVKLAEQGSTVLAYPALQRAVDLVGRDHVHFIALEDNRFILDTLGIIPESNVITVSSRTIPAMMRSLVSALRRMRALRLDAAVDLEFFSRGSAVLTFLSGARRRVGFHAFYGGGPYRGNLMTHRLFYNPHLHTTQVFLALVEAVTHDPAILPTFDWLPEVVIDSLPRFESRADEAAQVKALVWRGPGGIPPMILLNPNGSDLLPLRRWPGDAYVDLARRLLARYPDAYVVFTGAPSEAAAALDLTRRAGSPRCLSLAGQTTLRQLLVLYTLSRVLVTNDSGPAHFAAMTPIRVVTLFGPETPALFAAKSPRHTVLWAGLGCSPCVNAYNHRQSPCRNNICMQAITVEQVFSTVCGMYEQSIEDRFEPTPATVSA